jgi:hypothetical protein
MTIVQASQFDIIRVQASHRNMPTVQAPQSDFKRVQAPHRDMTTVQDPQSDMQSLQKCLSSPVVILQLSKKQVTKILECDITIAQSLQPDMPVFPAPLYAITII